MFLRQLLLWLTWQVRVFPFSSALTSEKIFLLIWILKRFWRWRDLNPQLQNQKFPRWLTNSLKNKHQFSIKNLMFLSYNHSRQKHEGNPLVTDIHKQFGVYFEFQRSGIISYVPPCFPLISQLCSCFRSDLRADLLLNWFLHDSS